MSNNSNNIPIGKIESIEEALEEFAEFGYYTILCPFCESEYNMEIDSENIINCEDCGKTFKLKALI